jgi:uncharacterized protein
MRILLDKTPKAPTVIVGFPGVGLVGPIVTEFLLDHMKMEQIGRFEYDELPAMVPIHKGKIAHPMSVHYSEKYNTIIVYTILSLKAHEWDVAEAVAKLVKDVQAKEVLCIDGATAPGEDDKIFAFGNPQLGQLGATMMEESVLVGVSAALLLTHGGISCVFASTQAEMPDSKAAANVVKFLDKYLGLEVDYQPLLEQATQFEEKLKNVATQAQAAMSVKEKRSLDYLG